MAKSQSSLWLFGFAAIIVAVVAGGLWFNFQQQEAARLKDEARLRTAHLTYTAHPGDAFAFGGGGHLPFELDLFGDGTIVFAERGRTYVTHAAPQVTLQFLKGFEASDFFQETRVEASIDGPGCATVYDVPGKLRESGCHLFKGAMFSSDLHPQIVGLEKLVDLPRLRNLDPDHLPADVRPYVPSPAYPVYGLYGAPGTAGIL